MTNWQAEIHKLNMEEQAAADNIVGWVTVLGLIVLLYFMVQS